MFRFTIRDVLWLTVVVGMALGCGRTQRKIETIRQGADDPSDHVAAIEQAAEGDNLATSGNHRSSVPSAAVTYAVFS